MFKKNTLFIFLVLSSSLMLTNLFAGGAKQKKVRAPKKIKLVRTKNKPDFVQYKLNKITLELKKGDILSQDTDAIVNAANEACLGGGGIDGYISSKGGASLLKARQNIPIVGTNNIRCPEIEARITRSGDIIKQNANIKFVVHAVGPMCTAGGMTTSDKKKLANTYINTLKRVNAFNKDPKDKKYIEFDKINTKDLKSSSIISIAFPTIGTGIFNCSTKDSAPSIVRSILNYARANQNQKLKRLVFVFYDPSNATKADQDFKYYKNQLDKYL